MTEKYSPIDGPVEDRKKRLKDIDAAERAQLIKAAAWLAAPLLVIPMMVAAYARSAKGLSLFATLLLGVGIALGGALFFYVIVYKGGIGGTAALLGRLYGGGSTTGTPMAKSYWRAQALSVRGDHAQALDSLELEALDDPGDPRPCLHAAAICTGELNDSKSAIEWYRRAQSAERIDPETHAYVSTRLVELYEALGEDSRAMVELRRLISLHPDSKYADHARRHLAAIKEQQLETYMDEAGGPPEERG